MASILRELVNTNRIARSGRVRLLKALADRNDLLLGMSSPTWEDINKHTFPNR